ncbi:MAG: nucleotidyltransferase [Phycisphaerales bacterium]|jgi:hypothetical protein|nr:nucleotidyltransferase [Phycisphaerales bacterium]MBT7170141.1 nucleotidyltransferase [Phycisphaerales bacterium]
MNKPQLVVMAAGMGSRYGGLKQIDPIGPNGEIVLDYAVSDAIGAGFEKVVFIIRKDIEEAFREKVGKTIESRIEVEYAFQELDKLPAGFTCPPTRQKPWGTGHAVLCAKDVIDGPFALINGDDFYGRSSFETIANHLRTAEDRDGVADWSMVAFVLANTLSDHGHVARGICNVTADGCLDTVVERTMIQRRPEGVQFSEDDGTSWKPVGEESLVSMNMWGLTTSYLSALEEGFHEWLPGAIDTPKGEYYIPTEVNRQLQANAATVRVLPTDEKWLGVTYQEDKPTVVAAIRALIDAGVYPESLWG